VAANVIAPAHAVCPSPAKLDPAEEDVTRYTVSRIKLPQH